MADFWARGEAPGFCVGESVRVGEGDMAQAVSIPSTEQVHLQAAVPPTPAKALRTSTWGPLDLRHICFLLSAFFFSGQALSAREDSCCHPQPCPRQPWPQSPRRSALSQLLICHHHVTLCGLITSPNHSLTLTSLGQLPGFLSLIGFVTG